MTIRKMIEVLTEYMKDVSPECEGEINIYIGKKMYRIRAISGFDVVPELMIEAGELVYNDET